MVKPSRNDPCPCGSGKKYKRCCLGTREAEEAAADRELRTADAVLDAVLAREPERLRQAAERVPPSMLEDDAFAPLLGVLLPFEVTDASGERLAPKVRASVAASLSSADLAWLDAQLDAHYSLHEVVEVFAGSGLGLRDLLTGDAHRIHDVGASETARRRGVLLGRRIRDDERWRLSGMHPWMLGPLEAERVVDRVEAVLDVRAGAVDPDRLRGEGAFLLVRTWHEVAEEGANEEVEVRLPGGEILAPTEHVFAYAAADEEAVLSGLARLPGASAPLRDEEAGFVVDVGRPDAEGGAEAAAPFPMPLGRVLAANGELRACGFSEAGADRLRTLLEEGLRGLVRHGGRRSTDLDAMASPLDDDFPDAFDALDGDGPALVGPGDAQDAEGAFGDRGPEAFLETDALVRAHKARHYETWADTPLPALDGLTPREALREGSRRRRVEALVRDIEFLEQRETPGRRYDVALLRRTLGLGP